MSDSDSDAGGPSTSHDTTSASANILGDSAAAAPRKSVKHKGVGKKSKPRHKAQEEMSQAGGLDRLQQLIASNVERERELMALKEKELERQRAEVEGDPEAIQFGNFLKAAMCKMSRKQLCFFRSACFRLVEEVDRMEETESQVAYNTLKNFYVYMCRLIHLAFLI